MKQLKINETLNDIVVQDGVFEFVEEQEELLQEIRSVLKTNMNEWFLDPTHGFDYMTLWGKNYDEEAVIQALFEALDQVERITSVDDITLDFDDRRRILLIDFRAYAGTEEIEGSEVMEL